MNKMNLAALVRGLFLDLTKKPHFVITDYANKEPAPNGAMCIEITSEQSEESSALMIRKAYENWKKTNPAAEDKIILPSCVAITLKNKFEVLFWIGDNYDSVQKKCIAKDASTFIVTSSEANTTITQEERSNIVKNKIALVTGGAQGIGEDIVRNLVSAGAFVFIADLNISGAKNLADKINASENRTAAFAVEVNVSSEESVEAMINTTAEITGGLDIFISNAGVLKAGSVLEQELSDFKFVTDINFTGFFIVSKFAGRLLRTQHLTAPNWKTDIIQVNSKSGLEGSNKNGAYAGGKFGGIGLVASFAMELIEYGIKVNAVCPGNFLDGPLWSDPDKGLFVQYLTAGKVPGAKTIADVRASYESRVPMKRGCTGKDLVRAIFYIIEQEYETGQAIPVTGGQIMLH
ncbi:MAG: SDR family NAD(P)-dependent oxidoreductase [Treponema sp.]|nr:SDR family NAD(P)-dependent oxidoreductase [Treponema sp.]